MHITCSVMPCSVITCRQDNGNLFVAHQQASDALGSETMELQWKSYVANLKASGSLTSAMAVCDVSGSMCGEPMQVRGGGAALAGVCQPPGILSCYL